VAVTSSKQNQLQLHQPSLALSCICLCLCICICFCICLCVCLCICLCSCLCICLNIFLFVFVFVFVFVVVFANKRSQLQLHQLSLALSHLWHSPHRLRQCVRCLEKRGRRGRYRCREALPRKIAGQTCRRVSAKELSTGSSTATSCIRATLLQLAGLAELFTS